jgi:hypothetical protein
VRRVEYPLPACDAELTSFDSRYVAAHAAVTYNPLGSTEASCEASCVVSAWSLLLAARQGHTRRGHTSADAVHLGGGGGGGRGGGAGISAAHKEELEDAAVKMCFIGPADFSPLFACPYAHKFCYAQPC